jgi:hypothetical protein
MNPARLPLILLFASGLALAGGTGPQTPAVTASANSAIRFPELPLASPICTNLQRVGLTDIKIIYSRPGKKHHTVFAGIVPYDTLWRTGDNASTKISFSTPVKLGGADGQEVPAGQYGLYTIPNEKTWTVILNKDAGLWGTDLYDEKLNVARFKVAPEKIDPPVENFTIDVNDIQDDSATINLMWDRVRVPIKVELNQVSDELVRIQGSMNSSAAKQAQTYLRAATFYLDHNADLPQALLWVNMGLLKPSPVSFKLLHVKARILAKQGDRAGAIAAAQESTRLALEVEAGEDGVPYLKMNQELMSGLH